MSGFFKRAKNKAKGMVESLRPPSRQGSSPSPGPEPSSQSTPNLGANPSPTSQPPNTTVGISSTVQNSSTPSLGSNVTQRTFPPPTAHIAPAYARPSAPSSALTTTGSVIHELLTTIRDASDMFLPLKAATVGVLKIWDVCERTVQLNQEFLKHKEKLERLVKIVITHQGESGLSDNLRERLAEIAASLQNLANAVQAKLDRGLTSRVLQSEDDIGEVKDLVDKTMSLIDVFEFEGGVRVEIGVDHINRRLSAAEQLQAAEKREEHLKQLKNSITTALDNHYVPEAIYDAQRCSGCMKGTRVDVLNQVFRWIMDPKARPIFWLGGMAGTGKTSIAWSICERVQADGMLCLGGSFFCSRSTGSAAQRDVRCIIPTLAQLLARQSDEFATALAAEVKKEPDLAYKQVKVQVERLLREPLTALSCSTRPIVFIVDALDECGDQPTATVPGDNSQAHAAVSEMLEALIDFSRSSAGLPIKFIVTSRPETHIRETSVTDTKVTSALHLHTIDKSLVTNDILLYIGKTLSDASVTEAWFTNDHVKTLAERADGLFIFAATATKYILGGGRDLRAKRLTNLVAPQRAMSTTLAVAPLDLMYSSILIEASRADMVEDDDLQQMLKIVAAILSARMTLSVEALAELLDLPTGYLRGCLGRLHAVVYLPEDNRDANLRTLHASFGDYLFTRAATDIRIASSLGHDELAHGCLRRMKRDDFNFNVSRSSSSYEPNPETEPEWITLSLLYACLHWAHHIQSASAHSAFDEAINMIFRPKFLFWLEVLSVLGEVRRASGLLRIVGFVAKSTEVSKFLRDANSFVASSRAAIEWSAPHIYLSAVPFAPKDSLIFRDFGSQLDGVVSVETSGIHRHGSRLIMCLTGHEKDVSSVAYSPDGRLLVSGSYDGTVRLWDTLTGEEIIAPLQSGDGAVRCVAFAANGQRVVSCTKDTGVAHIWDVRTGRAVMPPSRGHSGASLNSVAFSQDGQLIASVSENKSIRLWNTVTGQASVLPTGHDGNIESVTFSSDGHLLASTATDDTIRLWNIHTHELQGKPLYSPDGTAWSTAFSPDGKFIAAGCYDGRIRIWNVSTGEEIIAPFKAEDGIRSVAFAPSGSYVAYSDGSSIRFWNWGTNREAASALSGHSGPVMAISHSPDGLYIATASLDRTIRIWDAEHGQSITEQLPSHKGSIMSVAVSTDGSFVVSGSADRTIRVWDSQTAKTTLPPLMGHIDVVLSVAVSADGQLIASGSADCTVRLWNVKTGEPVGKPLKGHEEQVNAVTFSRDGLWLASAANDGTVGLWALGGDQPSILRQLRCGYKAFSVAFSYNGQRLAVGDYMGNVTVWDLSTDGEDTKPAEMQVNYGDIVSVCFSPDDSRIAAASLISHVYIWDVESRSLLHTLEGHSGSVRTVAYSPDGERLVSGGDDHTVHIWDTSTGQAVVILRGHTDVVTSVAFLPDGKTLVSGAHDETIRSWNVVNAVAPSSQANLSLFDTITQAYQEDGWLVGISKERLIWLPEEYLSRIVVNGNRTMLIGSIHIVLSVGPVIYLGKEWMKCWLGAKSSVVASSS